MFPWSCEAITFYKKDYFSSYFLIDTDLTNQHILELKEAKPYLIPLDCRYLLRNVLASALHGKIYFEESKHTSK